MIKRFFLRDPKAKLSDREKEIIESVIKTYDWGGFKSLISIEFINITDKYFQVKVEDTNNRWHNRFSQIICDKAHLQHLIITKSDGNNGLFDVAEEQ